METHPKPLHVVIAYDPSSGSILQAHFSAAAPADAEARLRRQSSLQSIVFRVLHVAADQLDPESHYRVDESGKLTRVEEGQRGFAAAAGLARRRGPQSPPIA